MNLRLVLQIGLALWWFTNSLAFGEVDFESEIRPLLNTHCTACHGGVKQAGDLSFVYDDQVLSVIEPGDPESSTLWHRVTSDDLDERMPPEAHGLP